MQSLEALHDKNASLASSNLELESTITQARGHVAIVRSSDYASARSLFDGLYARHQAVLTKLSPDVLLGQMRAEAQEVRAVAIIQGMCVSYSSVSVACSRCSTALVLSHATH